MPTASPFDTILDTPRGRLWHHATMAAATMGKQYHHARTQRGIHDPIMVVAAPDCPLGAAIIGGALGPTAPDMMAGPLVLALGTGDFLRYFNEEQCAGVAEALVGEGVKVVLCVNGMEVKPVVIAEPTREALVASITERAKAKATAPKARKRGSSGGASGAPAQAA